MKSLRKSLKRLSQSRDRKSLMRPEEDDEQPLLQKTESYARREKSGRSFVEPRIMTKKKSRSNMVSKRLSPVREGSPTPKPLTSIGRDIQELDFEEELIPREFPTRPGPHHKPSKTRRGGSDFITIDPNNPFSGKWLSESVGDEENFLTELEVSSKYSKLASKFGGSQQQTLDIVQLGNRFTITSNNDRREVVHKFTIGKEFYSENEKGDPIICNATWESDMPNTVLIVHARIDCQEPGTPHGSVRITRREILSSGQLREEVCEEDRSGNNTTRSYKRTR